jgi:hypothetical protein
VLLLLAHLVRQAGQWAQQLGWPRSAAAAIDQPLPQCITRKSCCHLVSGAVAGGQASNVATFVAQGDVALSVLMTAASTVAATVMTPTLTSLLAGAYIPVDGWVSELPVPGSYLLWRRQCQEEAWAYSQLQLQPQALWCLPPTARRLTVLPVLCPPACLPAALPPARPPVPLARPPHCLPQALFKSTVQLVLLPTVVGLLANEYFKKQVCILPLPTHPPICLVAADTMLCLCAHSC